MKRFLPALLTLALLPAAPLLAERLVLEETFEAYPQGELPLEEWPASETSSATWQFGRGRGPQSIISDERTSGNAFRFTENSPEHVVNYSFLQLPEPPGADARWKLSLRFYVELMESPGVVTLVGLYEGSVLTESSRREGQVTSFALYRNSRSGEIQAVATREGGTTFFREHLNAQTWYTLEITGDNSDGSLHFIVRDDGSFSEQLSGLNYVTTVQRFDHIVIGDSSGNKWEETRDNGILLDDLKLSEL